MKDWKLVLVAFPAVFAYVSVSAYADVPGPPTETLEAATGDTSGWELPKLPHVQVERNRDWYPDAARRIGLEGRVLIGFDIAADGRTKKVSVIWSENSAFESSAMEMLKGARYTVPADWGSAGALRRWRLGFVFRLAPGSCQSDAFAIPVETVIITASRLPGTPVRSGSGTSSAGSCPNATVPANQHK